MQGWLNARFGVWTNSTGWTRYRSAQGDCVCQPADYRMRKRNNQGGTAMIRPCFYAGAIFVLVLPPKSPLQGGPQRFRPLDHERVGKGVGLGAWMMGVGE